MHTKMFNKLIVRKALKKSLATDSRRRIRKANQASGQDSIISLLLHDIFGAEILKTKKNSRWHFYNRIEGERIDFAESISEKAIEINHFDDVPTTPAETYDYFDQVDYSNFFLRFVRAFEETVGLKKYRTHFSV